MTSNPKLQVIAQSGYKANERPASVVYDGQQFEVLEIEDRWIAADINPKMEVLSWFVVRCTGGARFKVRHGEESGWRGEILPGPRLV